MTTWEGDYMKAVVQLMTCMAKSNNVLFVDYQYTWKDVVFTLLGKSKAPLRRMFGLQPRLRNLATKQGYVTVLTPPPVFPTNWISFHWLHECINFWNARLVAKTIRHSLYRYERSEITMINAFNPALGVPLKKLLPVDKTVYYCYDDIAHASWCNIHGPYYEKRFIAQADEVVTTSKALYEAKEPLNPGHTHLVKNGVDFDLFHQGFSAVHIKKYQVVYLGSIDDRLDYDLIEFCAYRLPHVQFNFIGRMNNIEGANRLRRIRNVIIHGPQPPAALPGFLIDARVGIIPFIKNEFTRNIYPLKINEYLAAGLPVTMTDFAHLPEFELYAHFAEDQEDFVQGIVQSLMHQSLSKQMARAQVAQENSWQNRSQQFLKIINPEKAELEHEPVAEMA